MRRAWATGWCCAASSGTCAALSIPEGRIFDDGPDGLLEIAGPGSRVPRRVNAAWFCVATVDTSGEVQVLQRGQRVIVDRRAVQTTLDDIAVVAIRRLCRPVVSWASIARLEYMSVSHGVEAGNGDLPQRTARPTEARPHWHR
ncbi:hypothetical protein HDK77DRAFT_65261 [Phyllosticta capitalensis]